MNKKEIIILLCLIILLVGCKKKEEQHINFNQRSASTVKEDGWVYLYYCEFDKAELEPNENTKYWFGGYNLKYKELEGYSITIRDEKTGKIEVEATTSLPSLLYNEKYKSELKDINEFLNEKKFRTKITEKDLQVTVHTIKKEDIIELHNKAIESKNSTEGKYLYLPEANIIQEERVDKYRWQVGYLSLYGNLERINIQLIYEGNIYLSDLIENNTASEEQQKVYKYVKEIEALILKNQEFDQVDDQSIECTTIDFKRLSKLLKSIS